MTLGEGGPHLVSIFIYFILLYFIFILFFILFYSILLLPYYIFILSYFLLYSITSSINSATSSPNPHTYPSNTSYLYLNSINSASYYPTLTANKEADIANITQIIITILYPPQLMVL